MGIGSLQITDERRVMHNLTFSNSDPNIKGLQEAVISVGDFEKSLDFYTRFFGWEMVCKSDHSPSLLSIWRLDKSCKIEEALLKNPGSNEGFLRVVRFKNIQQVQIRSAAQTWDSGGIFDINIRTKNMASTYADFQKEGWHGYADPLRYTFGKYDVTEVLLKSPDGATVAVMERHHPPLVDFEFERISRIFNSSIISANIQESHDFYINKLGFQLFFKTDGDQRPHGPNVLGIPPNINGDITVPVHIYRPDINSFGSIEVLETKELKGKDCSALAIPPNLGLLMLRFPVRNAKEYAEQIQKKGVTLNTPIQNLVIKPYGEISTFSVRSPEGAWLEFIELL